jgi:hypothetical protein
MAGPLSNPFVELGRHFGDISHANEKAARIAPDGLSIHRAAGQASSVVDS